MQQYSPEIGVTQVNGLRPKEAIVMPGIEWRLRRDASDATTSFPHNRVVWINTGSDKLEGLSAHYCWILGVIPPAQGTLERPVSVMYVGFHQAKLAINPNTINQADLDRMHVYTADGSAFAHEFVGAFLGAQQPATAGRETISPWPVELKDEKPAEPVAEKRNADTGKKDS